jgi:hypothetical protein
MASFWKSIFGVFEKKPDPAALAAERRVRLNMLQNRFSLEVKKQDRFLREYLAQAVEAKRTGDAATLGPIKHQLAMTLSMRRRAQRMLHAVRLFATKSDQMEGYKDFCGVLSEVSTAMGETISTADVTKAQQDLQRGLQNAQTADQLMDQMLGAFDSAVGEMADAESDTAGVKSGALDDMIAKLAGEKDSAAEGRIEELLAKL